MSTISDKNGTDKNDEHETNEYKKHHPREEITRLVNEEDLEKLLLKAGELHGHFCPGVSIGVMAAVYGLKTLNRKTFNQKSLSDGMEDLLAIVETNNCFSDGIQYVTGCTFGNNSLIFRDFGKTAFTLTDRKGNGARITAKTTGDIMDREFPAFRELFEQVVSGKDHGPELMKRYKEEAMKASFGMLRFDFETLFEYREVVPSIPEYAPMRESVICEKCGEQVMAGKVVERDGRSSCIPCAETEFNQLLGEGIVRASSERTDSA